MLSNQAYGDVTFRSDPVRYAWPDVRMLPARDDVGQALSIKDEKKLLDGCADIDFDAN